MVYGGTCAKQHCSSKKYTKGCPPFSGDSFLTAVSPEPIMELSKQQDTYMDIQKRRTFIISFIYFGIIGVLCYIGLKKLLPILIPFMAAMAIAAMLEPAVSLLDRHMKGGKGAAAAVVLLVFYGSILTIMCVSGSQILSSIQEQAKKLPVIYSQTI